MTTEQAPNPVETQEFQFKLLARLRLFKDNPQLPLKQSLSLVAVSSKFGLIFVGTATGFDVIQTARIVEQCAGVKKPAVEVSEFPRRSITLGAQPTHLDISCDGHHLAVACAGIIRIYDVTFFTTRSERIVQQVRVLSIVQALSWNPGIPNMIATILQDGSAAVYELKNNSFEISSIPPEAQATCLCWSPKGKQIVIGSKNGTLNQFKPDLKIVKAIPPPQGDWSIVSVQWLSSLQYAATYCAIGRYNPNLVIINTPRNQPINYINYDDITYSNGDNRTNQFYFIHQQAWNVLLVASANSMEVGVLGRVGEGPWQQWQMEDAARAELPLTPSHQETHPVGMAMDISPQYNLPWGENQQLPPMPLLLLLSHEGQLTLYWCVNLMPGSVSVCEPPAPLPDTSGLHLFTTPPSAPRQQQTPSQQQSQAPTVKTPPAMVASVAPTSFAPPSAVSAPAPAFAPTSQWQQPPATSQPGWIAPPALSAPQPDNKSTTSAPSSWMSSPSLPAAFVAPSAFTATAPSSAANTAFAAPPINLSTTQMSDSFGKPGAFVQSSVPVITKSTPAPLPAVAVETSAKVEIPAVPSPVHRSPAKTPPTPEPEATEESEQLQKMNEALIQETIREEVNHFTKELHQLTQRVHNLKVNVLNDDALDKLSQEVQTMTSFMGDLLETTSAQNLEVDSLRTFLLEAFSYVESMKTRLWLQNNSDYMCIQSAQGLDPIQARKMADIRSNVQFIETQLNRVNKELADKWGVFQETNRENRETLEIPSLEAIYEAMVMQNSVIMKQKSLVEQLEAKVKTRSRKKLLELFNVSRMVEDIQLDNRNSDVSKITQDFLTLNLSRFKKETTAEELQESIADLSFSNSINNSHCEMSSEQMIMLQQIFNDTQIKRLDYNKIWATPVSSRQSAKPTTVTRTSTNTTASFKTSTVVKESKPATVVSETKVSFQKDPVKNIEEPKHKSPLTMPAFGATQVSFNLPNVKSETPQVLPSLGTKTLPSSSQNTQAINVNSGFSPGGSSQGVSAAPVFGMGSTAVSQPVCTLPISTQPIFAAPSATATKAFSFAPVGASPTKSPFASQTSVFGTATTTSEPPASNAGQPFVTFSKTFTFTTTASTSAVVPTMFTSSFSKAETPKSLSPSSLTSTPFKSAGSESGFAINVSTSPIPTPTNPLVSLTSLVSGIEPLKPNNESPISTRTSTETIKPTANQPFVFKVPSENKSSPVKEASPKLNVFSFALDDKQDSKDVPIVTSNSPIENKNLFGGAFKKLSFESASPKSVFGGTSTSISTALETAKSDQSSKNSFSFSSTTGLGSISTSNSITSSPQSQKSIFGGTPTTVSLSVSPSTPVQQDKHKDASKIGDSQLETTSPVIEVTLTPPKNMNDPKITLEKLTASKGLTITKVESPELKSAAEESHSDADSTAPSLFGSLSLGSFTTPTKSTPSIFGGSSPAKPPVLYEIPKLETEVESSSEQQRPETSVETEKHSAETDLEGETEKEAEINTLQSAFGEITASKATSASSFSFSSSSLQSAKTTQPTTGFTFGFKTLATTTAAPGSSADTTSQASSTFSFAQPATTSAPDSTAFSFSLPTTSAPTTASSAFGIGSLSTALSDDKAKSAFSFGQQVQTTSTTTASIFGGFGGKPVEGTSIFGQATIGGGENKTIFGQTPSTTGETKSVFGQTPSSTSENKNVFGTPVTTAESKSIFGQSSTTTENKSIFGQSPATTANVNPEFSFSLSTPSTGAQSSFFGTPATTATSFFGQQICSPTSTASSPFGQPTSTPSVFGSPAASPFGGTSTFDSKPAFGQSGGSLFAQSSGGFGSSGGSMFGGSGFGSTPQPANLFGSPSSGSPGTIFGGGSFSTGGQTVGQTGFGTPAFQNKPAAFASTSPQPAFGAPPAFGGAPTFGGSPAFGSPPKLFGSPTAPTPGFGGNQQQSSTFENMANQNTMTFGNLAQNQSTGFSGGSLFGGAQQPTGAPAFPPATTSSVFGGSSFTSWR